SVALLCAAAGTSGSEVIAALSGTETEHGVFAVHVFGAGGCNGNGGADTLLGGDGNDILKGQDGEDVIYGGAGDDQISGGRNDDLLYGGAGADLLHGNGGNDTIEGGDGADLLYGDDGNDQLEGGAGNDILRGGAGADRLLAFSWAGEPVPAQDANAQVNTGEPLEDNDILYGGSGADVFEFRWLIDAKDEIIAKHTDANGDIDYSMNGVAGENDNVHDHWVETIGVKTVADFEAGRDSLVFEGHTVQLGSIAYEDRDGNGQLDSVLSFVSNQGGNGGAHDGDAVGQVVILNAEINAGDIAVDAGVFYGVEEPWSVLG
ncbi:MAG: hypothetical protein ACPGVJ_12170, partial [Mangrovicoccus sp.]